jgi:hypothetical protein
MPRAIQNFTNKLRHNNKNKKSRILNSRQSTNKNVTKKSRFLRFLDKNAKFTKTLRNSRFKKMKGGDFESDKQESVAKLDEIFNEFIDAKTAYVVFSIYGNVNDYNKKLLEYHKSFHGLSSAQQKKQREINKKKYKYFSFVTKDLVERIPYFKFTINKETFLGNVFKIDNGEKILFKKLNATTGVMNDHITVDNPTNITEDRKSDLDFWKNIKYIVQPQSIVNEFKTNPPAIQARPKPDTPEYLPIFGECADDDSKEPELDESTYSNKQFEADKAIAISRYEEIKKKELQYAKLYNMQNPGDDKEQVLGWTKLTFWFGDKGHWLGRMTQNEEGKINFSFNYSEQYGYLYETFSFMRESRDMLCPTNIKRKTEKNKEDLSFWTSITDLIEDNRDYGVRQLFGNKKAKTYCTDKDYTIKDYSRTGLCVNPLGRDTYETVRCFGDNLYSKGENLESHLLRKRNADNEVQFDPNGKPIYDSRGAVVGEEDCKKIW